MSETPSTYDPRDYRKLAKILLKEEAIAYRPSLAKAFGGVTAALFLSQLLYWSDKTRDTDGWIYKSQAEMEEETGMTRREQDTARRKLVQAGVLEEERRGLPARLFYRVQWDTLFDKLVAQKRQTGLAESANQYAQKRQSITETTTETTTESLPPEEVFSADATKTSSFPLKGAAAKAENPQKSKSVPRGQPTVTDEFRDKMKAKHSDHSAEDVDFHIDQALNHKASNNWKDVELGVQGWLRREFRDNFKAKPRGSPPAAKANTKPPVDDATAEHERLHRQLPRFVPPLNCVNQIPLLESWAERGTYLGPIPFDMAKAKVQIAEFWEQYKVPEAVEA